MQNTVENLPSEVKAQAVSAARPAAALMDRVGAHHQAAHHAPSSHSGDREALVHNQSSTGRTQAALSPTDGHKGHTESQSRGRGMER